MSRCAGKRDRDSCVTVLTPPRRYLATDVREERAAWSSPHAGGASLTVGRL
jgi:hypothetical protein